MDRTALERIDSFPYRHRIADLMSGPVVDVAADATIDDAVAAMLRVDMSSLFVTDAEGRALGILTEHDVLTAIAEGGRDALSQPVRARMSSPVHAVVADAFVYTAIARMDRLGVRHLAVTDVPDGRLVGVVSARALLRQRAEAALILGDEIAQAHAGAEMAAAQAKLPALARGLLAEKVPVLDVAGVLSAVLRDMSARAAELAEAAMVAEGHGSAPAPWCYLVLGSGGRGESLLSADQDNAIIHAGGAGDDAWYAELGRHASDMLNAAGIPYCKGKVMASNPAWRGTLDDWTRRIAGWVERPSEEALLNVDIFYDFRPVYGDFALAEALRGRAVAAAKGARLFLSLMAAQLGERGAPLGLFGRIITEAGRVDLKRGGVMPIVAGARVLALRGGTSAVATGERLADAVADGALNEGDAAMLQDAFETLMALMLEQQILDVVAGRAPSPLVEVNRLSPRARARLKSALRSVQAVDEAVRTALSTGG